MECADRTRTLRIALLIVLVIAVFMGEAPVASADQFIRYKGDTSSPSPNNVYVGVIKRDGGKRQLRYITFQVTVTCEDGSANQRKLVLRYRPLDADGGFSAEVPRNPKRHVLRVDGSIRWGRGNGTLTYRRTESSTNGPGTQVCTTSELSWEVERTGARPY